MIAFGADIDALNFNQQTPLDIACNEDIRELLFIVGSESGNSVRERLDNYKQLPPAPVISLEESGIDWRGLSQSNDATSLSSSLLPAVMNNYTAWLEWRQKQRVCSYSLHHYCLPFEICISCPLLLLQLLLAALLLVVIRAVTVTMIEFVAVID